MTCEQRMWKSITEEYATQQPPNSAPRTEVALGGKWKLMAKDLGYWRDALSKAKRLQHSGSNLTDELNSAKVWYQLFSGKKTFRNFHCWEIVGDLPKFQVIAEEPCSPRLLKNSIHPIQLVHPQSLQHLNLIHWHLLQDPWVVRLQRKPRLPLQLNRRP